MREGDRNAAVRAHGGGKRIHCIAFAIEYVYGRARGDRAVRTLYGIGRFSVDYRLGAIGFEIDVQIGIAFAIAIVERGKAVVPLQRHGQAVRRAVIYIIAYAAGFHAPQLGDVRAVSAALRGEARRAVRIELRVRAQEGVVKGYRAIRIGVGYAHFHLVQAGGAILRECEAAVLIRQREVRLHGGGFLCAAYAARAVHVGVLIVRSRGGIYLAAYADLITGRGDFRRAAADAGYLAVRIHDGDGRIGGRPLPCDGLRIAAADGIGHGRERYLAIRLGKRNAVCIAVQRSVIRGKAAGGYDEAARRAFARDDVIALRGFAVRRGHGRPRHERQLEVAAVVIRLIGRIVVDVVRGALRLGRHAVLRGQTLQNLQRSDGCIIFRTHPQAVVLGGAAIFNAQYAILAQHRLRRIAARRTLGRIDHHVQHGLFRRGIGMPQIRRIRAQRIVRAVIAGPPAAARHGGTAAYAAFGIAVEGIAVCRGICIAGIHDIDLAHGLIRAAARRIPVAGNIIDAVQAVIEADQRADVAVAGNLTIKGIVLERIGNVVPRLRHIHIAAQNTADVAVAGNGAAGFAADYGYLLAVRCGAIAIAAADDAARVAAAGDHLAAERAVQYVARAHGVIDRADDAADVILALDGAVVYAVFDRALHTAREAADFAVFAGVSDHNAGFDRAIADDGVIARAAARVGVFKLARADQTGIAGLRAGLQRDMIDDHRRAGHTHAGKAVHQTIAVDLRAIDVQIADGRAVDIRKQRTFARGHGQQLIAAVEHAGEGVQVRAPADAVRTILGAADGLPAGGQGDILGHLEYLALEAVAALDQHGQAFQILRIGQLVGIFFGAFARKRKLGHGDDNHIALDFAVLAVYGAAHHAVVFMFAELCSADFAFPAAGGVFAIAIPMVDVLRALQLLDLDGHRVGTQTLFVGRAHGLLGDLRRFAGFGAVIEYDHGSILLKVFKGGGSEVHRIPLFLGAAEVDDFRMAIAAAVRIVGQVGGQIQFLQVRHVGHGVGTELFNTLQIHIRETVGEVIVAGKFPDALRQNQLAQTIAMIDHVVQLGQVLRQMQVGQVGAGIEYTLAVGRIRRIGGVLEIDAGDAGAVFERKLTEVGNGRGQVQASLHAGAAAEAAVSDLLQARRNGDHRQRGAAVERAAADFLKAVRQVDARQIGAAFKCLITDLHDGIRQRDLLQNRLIHERALTNFGNAVRNDQFFLFERQHDQNAGAAVYDAVLAAEGAALGKVDGLERRAAVERLCVQAGQALGQVHGGQRRAVLECAAANLGCTLAHGDGGQRRAAAKRIVARHVAADGNLGQLSAFFKYAVGGDVYTIGQIERLELGLTERAVID